MKVIPAVALQVILAFVLGVITPYGLGIGNSLELVAIPVGISAAIWIPGYLIQKVSWKELVGTLVGAGALMALVNYVLPPMGFNALALPILGGFVGYYVTFFSTLPQPSSNQT